MQRGVFCKRESHCQVKVKVNNKFNSSIPNSDPHQFSPCNINAYSTTKVMRIKDVITQREFP